VPGGKVAVFHFIGFDEINDVHRKAGSVVQNDRMPDKPEMELLFKNAGLIIEFIRNDKNGYFLMARK
jgi:demethylmenaquinone methyltransferase/2-methoxy-6-polyprenyl-1,4-benzoquinol methylase